VSPPGPIGGDEGPEAHPGDMARRITRRRTDLGQSIEELAEKAGVDPGYLRYFEESAGGQLSAGTVLLLALALECSPEDLYGGPPTRQPGRGRAGRHPELRELTVAQCEAHVRDGGVGRVVFLSPRGPVAHPVNFAVSEGDVIVSTAVSQAEELESRERVSFEIDRVDEVMSEGWSVLVTGEARRVDDPEEVLALVALGLLPSAGGSRHALVRIRPHEITGRVIVRDATPDDGTGLNPR
jgi:nitroimidazol reductase NimA-like FMN-containing flavoprotein (pyridoxamine 5'-phosphate oxidase superfamily)